MTRVKLKLGFQLRTTKSIKYSQNKPSNVACDRTNSNSNKQRTNNTKNKQLKNMTISKTQQQQPSDTSHRQKKNKKQKPRKKKKNRWRKFQTNSKYEYKQTLNYKFEHKRQWCCDLSQRKSYEWCKQFHLPLLSKLKQIIIHEVSD